MNNFPIDTSECDISNGGCEDGCVDTDGSFHCTCGTGFQLSENGYKCQGKCYNNCIDVTTKRTNWIT